MKNKIYLIIGGFGLLLSGCSYAEDSSYENRNDSVDIISGEIKPILLSNSNDFEPEEDLNLSINYAKLKYVVAYGYSDKGNNKYKLDANAKFKELPKYSQLEIKFAVADKHKYYNGRDYGSVSKVKPKCKRCSAKDLTMQLLIYDGKIAYSPKALKHVNINSKSKYNLETSYFVDMPTESVNSDKLRLIVYKTYRASSDSISNPFSKLGYPSVAIDKLSVKKINTNYFRNMADFSDPTTPKMPYTFEDYEKYGSDYVSIIKN